MQWLLHGDSPSCMADALRARGDTVHAVEELGLGPVADLNELLQAAHKRQWDVLTADPHLAQAPFDGRARFGRSIVFLQLEGGDAEQSRAIGRLFARHKRLSPGRLYTVTATRVKVRQLPTGN